MKLYQIAILAHEKNEDDKIIKTDIITDVKSVVAKDEKTAAMMAARLIPSDYDDQLDNIEVLVRPF